MKIEILAAVVVASAGLQGQAIISPAGWANAEGKGWESGAFSRQSLDDRVYAHVDDEARSGGPRMLLRIAWRRDGLINGHPAMAARDMDIEVLAGEAVYSRVQSFQRVSFGSLYRTPPTTVYTRKRTSLPNWIPAPTSVPAPFDLRLPFDVPLLYSGNDALMYELRSANAQNGVTYCDWAGLPSSTQAIATPNGGCGPYGSSFARFTVYGSAAPTVLTLQSIGSSQSWVWAVLGASPATVPIPGFCLPIRNSAEIIVVGFSSTPLGIFNKDLGIVHDPAYVGWTLHSQFVYFDFAARLLAMTEGMNVVYPAPPVGLPRVKAAIEPTSFGWATSGTFKPGSALVTEFAYQ